MKPKLYYNCTGLIAMIGLMMVCQPFRAFSQTVLKEKVHLVFKQAVKAEEIYPSCGEYKIPANFAMYRFKLKKLNVDSLELSNPDYRISSCQLWFLDHGKSKDFLITGNKIPEEVKQLIAKVAVGSKVYIECIKYVNVRTQKIYSGGYSVIFIVP